MKSRPSSRLGIFAAAAFLNRDRGRNNPDLYDGHRTPRCTRPYRHPAAAASRGARRMKPAIHKGRLE